MYGGETLFSPSCHVHLETTQPWEDSTVRALGSLGHFQRPEPHPVCLAFYQRAPVCPRFFPPCFCFFPAFMRSRLRTGAPPLLLARASFLGLRRVLLFLGGAEGVLPLALPLRLSRGASAPLRTRRLKKHFTHSSPSWRGLANPPCASPKGSSLFSAPPHLCWEQKGLQREADPQLPSQPFLQPMGRRLHCPLPPPHSPISLLVQRPVIPSLCEN